MLSSNTMQTCVAGMFEYRDFGAFKSHLRDFLVQARRRLLQNLAPTISEVPQQSTYANAVESAVVLPVHAM